MPFYEDTIYRQYFAVSKWGNLCNVLGLVLVTILPFIVTFAIGTLWSKEDSFRMQPTVFWPKKALLVVWNAQADQQQPQAFVWTSMAKANRLLGDALTVPHLEYYPQDADEDGRVDRLQYDFHVPLPGTFRVTAVELLLLFQYSLEGKVDVEMEAPCYVQHSSPKPGQGFVTEGDLRFRQRKPLFWNSVVYNASYFEPATIRGVGDILLPGLLQRYAARNCTTEYVPSLGYWLPSPEAGADPQHAAAEGSEFHLSVTVRVPHEVYLYWRGPWEVLKLAWLQYFSVAFPMYWLFVKVKGFLVKSGLLVTRCVSELRPKYKY